MHINIEITLYKLSTFTVKKVTFGFYHSGLKKNMGLKRPFDAEEMQECNAKHARQLTYHPDQFDQSMPFHVPLDKTAVLGTVATSKLF